MKKLALILAALSISALFAMGANCSGGATPCTTDADCKDATTPACDAQAQVCVPAECSSNVDCQLINPAAPTTVQACAADADCAADNSEACVKALDATVCAVLSAGAGGCGTDVEVAADDIGGGSVNVCGSSAGTCSSGGSCSF